MESNDRQDPFAGMYGAMHGMAYELVDGDLGAGLVKVIRRGGRDNRMARDSRKVPATMQHRARMREVMANPMARRRMAASAAASAAKGHGG